MESKMKVKGKSTEVNKVNLLWCVAMGFRLCLGASAASFTHHAGIGFALQRFG